MPERPVFEKFIEIEGARQHNLKNFSLRVPKSALSVITGPSGSGKSSLAFNTIFAEGQRRYMESLSTYARQFMEKHEKPEVDEIRGLQPTIAIEQKNHTKNSRSTVGTATEIYDYLRILYSKIGVMYCPKTKEIVKRDIVRDIASVNLNRFPNQKALVVFPLEMVAKSKSSERKRLLLNLIERGYSRVLIPAEVKINKPLTIYDLQDELAAKSTTILGKAQKSLDLYVVTDRFTLEIENKGRFEEAVVSAYSEGFGRCRVIIVDDDLKTLFEGRYSEYPSTNGGENRYPELSPLLFSFNSPAGACESCKGFGNTLEIDEKLVVPNPNLSLAQGAIEPLTKPSAKNWLRNLLLFCQKNKIPLHSPWSMLSEDQRTKIWSGNKDFEGVLGMFKELEDIKYKMQVRVFLSRYRSPKTCSSCLGQRLRPEARNVLVHEMGIAELCKLSIKNLKIWFDETKFSATEKEIAKDLLPQIQSRLDFLLRVGLSYLSLDRLAKTLSGGEAQRIALANQLGARLTQTCYVLDEPSIGLHPRDTERLIGILKDLAKLKNTVIVVEHDPDVIKNAEYLVDIGPEAGTEGGYLLYQGPFSEYSKVADLTKASSTARFLSGLDFVPVPMRRRHQRFEDKKKSVSYVEMTGLSENNLKKVSLKIPHQMLTCITGVSGSGKSSAIRKTLYPALARILAGENIEVGPFEKISGYSGIKNIAMIDQSPIGRSPRSNPITFMKSFDEVRNLMASTQAAKRKRFHAGHFSFNVPGGRCETCEGDGYIRVEMVFMEDLFLKCEHCEGKRFKPEVLEITYQDKNIDDILNMTVTDARKFFGADSKRLAANLRTLEQVGLGYVKLGQSSTTLSGGESQRLKIARELSSVDNNGHLYVLDEPTTGLHYRDVKVLIRVLNHLVENGNTVVVIEHNLDVMKCSDWIIDFGPEGGDKGGHVVFEGTPENLLKCKKSVTAEHLKDVLENSPKVSVNDFLGIKEA